MDWTFILHVNSITKKIGLGLTADSYIAKKDFSKNSFQIIKIKSVSGTYIRHGIKCGLFSKCM